MGAKPNYLIHWTGKDIATSTTSLNIDHRKAYLKRFVSIIQNGFWMNRNSDELWGMDSAHIYMNVGITCFTEHRLTNSFYHTMKYGMLGIGVSREFVLDRWGAPVVYLENSSENDVNTAILHQTWKYLKNETKPEHRNVYLSFLQFLNLMKPMSNANTRDFEYIDEGEWRIVQYNQLDEKGLLVIPEKEPPHRLVPIKKNEVKLIILPDRDSINMFYSEPEVIDWFNNLDIKPSVLTLEELKDF